MLANNERDRGSMFGFVPAAPSEREINAATLRQPQFHRAPPISDALVAYSGHALDSRAPSHQEEHLRTALNDEINEEYQRFRNYVHQRRRKYEEEIGRLRHKDLHLP